MSNITINILDNTIYGDKVYNIDNISMWNIKRNSTRIKLLKYSCVYILLGPLCNRRLLYIGLTTNIGRRLALHLKAKDWWEEVIFFVDNEHIFTTSEILWLEEKLIKSVIDSNYYDIIKNYQIPNNVVIYENNTFKGSELLETIKSLLYIFGCPITQINSIVESSTNIDSKSIVDRIARAYKYLPNTTNYDNYIDEEAQAYYYKDVEYYDLVGLYYIPKSLEHKIDNDKYFKSEIELKTYIDRNGK